MVCCPKCLWVMSVHSWQVSKNIITSYKRLVRNQQRWGGGIINLGSEMRWSIPAMGVKFVNPPLELGLKYHDPPPLVIIIKSSSCNTLGWVSIMKTQRYFYLFFVMLYTYILDDRIKSLTLILTADYLTLLFLPGFFFFTK